MTRWLLVPITYRLILFDFKQQHNTTQYKPLHSLIRTSYLSIIASNELLKTETSNPCVHLVTLPESWIPKSVSITVSKFENGRRVIIRSTCFIYLKITLEKVQEILLHSNRSDLVICEVIFLFCSNYTSKV